MSALTAERRLRREKWSYQTYLLPTGLTAFKGGIATYDRSLGKCVPASTGAGSTDLFMLGCFAETIVNSSGSDLPVTVELKKEITVVWFANDGGNPVTVNDIGSDIFALDDQTVSLSSASSTRSVIGKPWAIDSVRGVAVEVF